MRRPKPAASRGFTMIELMVALVIIGIIMCYAIPNLAEAKKMAIEISAIGSLSAIVKAEAIFRDRDVEKDGIPDYGQLSELQQAELVDELLGAGRKEGYRFVMLQADYDTFRAQANPSTPGVTGDRYFYVDPSGVIYASALAPINSPTDVGVTPVGR